MAQTRSLTRHVLVALALSLLLLFAIVLSSVRYNDMLRGRNAAIAKNYRAITVLASVRTALINAETGERGYLITGQPEYLEPYELGRRELTSLDTTIRALFGATNPTIIHLAALLHQRTALLDEGIRLRKVEGFPSAQEWVERGTGKRYMDSVRALVGALLATEGAELQATLQSSASLGESIVQFNYVVAGAFVIVLCTAGWIYHSDRKLHETTERRSKHSVDFLRQILNTLHEALLVVDDAGIVRSANQGFSAMTGIAERELLGRTLQSVHDVRDNELLLTLANFQSQRADGDNPLPYIRNKGIDWTEGSTIHYAQVNLERFEQNGVQLSLIAIADETERRSREVEIEELNRTLSKNERALRASVAELESFTYTVSHDLRAPLRAITGFASALVESTDQALTEESRHYLSRITTGAQHMARLIDDLLAFSKTGRKELRCVWIDTEYMVQQIWRDLTMRNATTTSTAPPVVFTVSSLPQSFGDPNLLHQVWENLLSNALKYSRSAASPRVEVGATNRRYESEFFVRDNGVGFDMQYADKIFGVFQRLHSSTEFEGTGVGLAIVRRIVERHEGSVRAIGFVNQGATISFTLPHPADTLPPVIDSAMVT